MTGATLRYVTDTLGTIFEVAVTDMVRLEGSPLSDSTNTGRIKSVILDCRLFQGTDLGWLLL